MKVRNWGSGTLLLLSVALASPAWGLSPKSFLLRIEGEFGLISPCQRTGVETLIFADGLVIDKVKREEGVLSLYRMTAPPGALRRLRAALRENKIGSVPSNCVLGIFQPNAVTDLSVTWFGKPNRSTTFFFSSSLLGERCPESVQAIRSAINQFLDAAATDPEVERVDIPIERSCD